MSLLSPLLGVKSAGAPLVLRRYTIDDGGKLLVDIVGRQSGVIVWMGGAFGAVTFSEQAR